MESVLKRLRTLDINGRIGRDKKVSGYDAIAEFTRSGVKFAVSSGSSGRLEDVYYDAVRRLPDCIAAAEAGGGILQEGGVYHGCWLESTGTINAELLSRFLPSVSRATYEQFADYQRGDGLLPYKITADGPVFKQIQLVTPLARSVWNHYLSNGRDDRFLRKMYDAMTRFDGWLEKYRNTRGSGCVEAFCTFDTGHDLSARFWHVADTPHLDDPRRFHPDSPLVPFLAPDLTANVYCSRKYYILMAGQLNEPADRWAGKAEQSLQSLMSFCFDPVDSFFYDVDRSGRFVRIQTDVLLRVLACEVGDDEFFAAALRRYLLNTRKFFAKYPFTSVAMDDPRFDPHSSYNSWSGAVNFLSLIRAAHAFEYHGRFVELTWILTPIVSAISRLTRFGQCLSPWTGEEGYTESYSPAILCVLDFIERLCGIVPTPEGELWFTGLLPYPMDHGVRLGEETAYCRLVDGRMMELVNNAEQADIYVEERLVCRFPYGIRVITDRRGALKAIAGMVAREVEGIVEYEGIAFPIRIGGNEKLVFEDGIFSRVSNPGVVLPEFE